MTMTRMLGGKKLELVCILCNESLADLERACAGLLGNSNKNEHQHAEGACADSAAILSEANSTIPDTSGAIGGHGGVTGFGTGGPGPPVHHPQYGGYMPLSEHNHKQVVATKCGHMFHQGCLKKHVHKTLIEGKGGSLFCPMCTRPFAMNRLWPVIIPPTKSQRERYLQLKIMKNQNVEMVKQLKEIRAKIAEEEENLKRIKEDSEQCLHDIQQKQKLLDSVNGPTNKEMAELTKVHMKRQEILHVVTQHNADLLKLLAEESNITTATAENMINVNVTNHGGRADINQNIYPSSASGFAGEQYAHRVGSGEEYPIASNSSSRKFSRKSKKGKSSKKRSKKKRSRRRHHYESSPTRSKSRVTRRWDGDLDSERGSGSYPAAPQPSELIPGVEETHTVNGRHNKKHSNVTKSGGCRKVDTLSKWKIESMKELMSLPGFSEMNADISNTSTAYGGKDDDYYPSGKNNHRQQATSHKDSVNILLSRKPNMFDKDGFGGVSKK